MFSIKFQAEMQKKKSTHQIKTKIFSKITIKLTSKTGQEVRDDRFQFSVRSFGNFTLLGDIF